MIRSTGSRQLPDGFIAGRSVSPIDRRGHNRRVTFDERLTALSDPDYLVRLRGILALVPHDPTTSAATGSVDPSLVSPLLGLADDPTKQVRNAAVRALGIIASSERGVEGKERLRSALGDPSWRVRFTAARAYNYLRYQPVEPLVPLLDDDVESVRWAAVSALSERRFGRYGKSIVDPSTVAPLRQALDDTAPRVRAAAISGLRAEDGSEAFAALEAGLRDVDHRVRSVAAAVLRDSRAVPALIGALDDQFLWVRMKAAGSLGSLRDARAVEPLAARLHDRNRYMRREAARALGAIGEADAIPVLTALRDRSTLDWVWEAATEAIGRIDGSASDPWAGVWGFFTSMCDLGASPSEMPSASHAESNDAAGGKAAGGVDPS
jgi:HEAT repeat protein